MLEGLKNLWFKELQSLPESAEGSGVWPFTGNPREWIDKSDPNYTPSIYADRPSIDVTGSGVINSVGKSGLKPILRQLKSDIVIPLEKKSMTKILRSDRSDFLRNQKLLPPKSAIKGTPKIGDMVKLPGGKARFDGVWEASGSYPERYQYTYHEGLAKGDTFISASHDIADVVKAGMKKLEMRGAKPSNLKDELDALINEADNLIK